MQKEALKAKYAKVEEAEKQLSSVIVRIKRKQIGQLVAKGKRLDGRGLTDYREIKVEQGIIEMNSLNLGLDELVGKTGKEIRAPIGRGIFVKAKLISEELNVDIGQGNIVKKSIPETKKLIEEQIKKLEQVRLELEKNLEVVGRELEKVMGGSQKREEK